MESVISSQPPLKKQKIVHEYFTLELLLQQNWFLIELGRKLIGIHDTDLLNILVLNKKINQRATPIFRQYFIDIPLQRKARGLIKKLKFDQIQKLFEENPLSLNPNMKATTIFFSKHPNSYYLQKCIHEQQRLNLSWQGECICMQDFDGVEDCHLILPAMRLKLNSLVRLMIFHPKFQLPRLAIAEIGEVFAWAAVNGDFKTLCLILEQCNNALIELTMQEDEFVEKDWQIGIDISFAVAASIRYENFKIFSYLMNLKREQGIRKVKLSLAICDYIRICALQGELGLKYYEMFLNSKIVRFDRHMFGFNLSNELGVKYFKISINALLSRGTLLKFYELPDSDIDIVFRYFSVNLDDKEGQKIAAKFAILSCNFEKLENILQDNKFDDSELLDFFQTPKIKNAPLWELRSLKLILEKLSSTTKILSIHVERFLLACIHAERLDSNKFFEIWNEKRFQPSPELIYKLIFRSIKFGFTQIVEILLPLVSMNDSVEYNIGRKYSPEIVKTTFRNCIWLEDIRRTKNRHPIEFKFELNKTMEMDEVLFDLTFRLYLNNGMISHVPNFGVLNTTFTKEEWWTTSRIHSLSLSILKYADNYHFKLFVNKFPDYDFSSNDNEGLRVFLESRLEQISWPDLDSQIIFKFLETKIRYASIAQRTEILDLGKLKRDRDSRFVKILSAIPVVGVDDQLWEFRKKHIQMELKKLEKEVKLENDAQQNGKLIPPKPQRDYIPQIAYRRTPFKEDFEDEEEE